MRLGRRQRPLVLVHWLRRWFNHFRVNRDSDIIADNYAAVVKSGVPLHPVVLAIDFGSGIHSDALVAPRILHRSSGTFDVKNDFLGRATDREVAGDLEFSGGDLFHLLDLKVMVG